MSKLKFKTIEPEVKLKLLKALFQNKISKDDLKNIDEILMLLDPHIVFTIMGDNISFKGKQIDRKEYDRLMKLSDSLGIKDEIISFTIDVIDTGYKLASSEDEIEL